jgi:delta8-fatty-acid desaturase
MEAAGEGDGHAGSNPGSGRGSGVGRSGVIPLPTRRPRSLRADLSATPISSNKVSTLKPPASKYNLLLSPVMGKPDRPSWSRQQIADRILKGENLVIYRGQLIRVPPSWLEEHPGGSIAILHFVGRDASDEIEAFHSDTALQRLLKHSIGDVQVCEGDWDPLLPPIAAGWVRRVTPAGPRWHREAERMHSNHESHFTSASQVLLVKRGDLDASADPCLTDITPPPTTLSLKVQTAHSNAYKALHQRITDAGLYQTPYLTGYGPEIIRYISLFVIAVIAYHFGWYKTAALFHGFLWHQLVFTAHDLGHVGVTHNWVIDRILGITIANFMGGLSISWWTEVRRKPQPFPCNRR